jgi:hypothetical protein
LRPYSVEEIAGASRLHSQERMNSVHPYHRPEHLAEYKHYIFAFHDSTFECIAQDFDIEIHRGSIGSAVRLMAAMLDSGRLKMPR